jgi:hypothetical protein
VDYPKAITEYNKKWFQKDLDRPTIFGCICCGRVCVLKCSCVSEVGNFDISAGVTYEDVVGL